MKYDNQLRYALNIIRDYDGSIPLASWLKDFFRANKQMGSRDRKTVAEMIYSFYRLGRNEYASIESRMLAAIRLSPHLEEVSRYLKDQSEYHKYSDKSDFSTDKIFPFPDELSEGISRHEFETSFLVQPDVFIRVRPGKKGVVLKKLQDAGISFTSCDDDCIAVPAATRVDEILQLNAEAVIQDKSSQRIATLFPVAELSPRENGSTKLWDCCAASGGKSLLAYDKLGRVDITVSDIRESIIRNLRIRFREAGIEHYRSFVADLTKGNFEFSSEQFDLIIADLPCTGSGTWARTPEQLYFSTANKIDYYSHLQQTISAGLISSMAKNGYLIYVTCSVFKKENEDVVEMLKQKGLRVIRQQLFEGYRDKADTLFGALLTNSSA